MNSWHANQFKYALGIGGLMSFYGIAGFLTFTVGPRLGLEMSHQIIVLILLLLTLPFTLIIGYLATRKSSKEEAAATAESAAAESGEQTSPTKTAPVGSYEGLPAGIEEVVKFLQTSNLAGTNSKEAVYALPWYLVTGMPKTGKSSLVIGSNLNFQTLPSQRQSELKLVRSTRSIDWRVTDEAVFADTSGRYHVEGGDEDEWNAVVETLRKNRPARPLDGLIIVADTERILGAEERQLEEWAKVIRARLDEVIQRTKIKFPVYLVFSHADAIEGFKDSFSASKKEGETLVWGATIPLEKSENAHAMFDEEFGLLQTSIMRRRLMRLSAPFPPVRQLRIFNFPLHFGSARQKLGSFVSALFRPNPFSENPFLRGFYFASAPAKATQAIGDKTMGSIAPPAVGQTFFTERLFRDVILRDKDLAATFINQRQKPPILGWFLTLTGATVVLALLILSGVSLYYNRLLLRAAEEKGGALLMIVRADANVDPRAKSADDAKRELIAIDNLRSQLVELDTWEREGAPFYFGMGLYSGNEIYLGTKDTTGLFNIYHNAIERRFMRPTMLRVEKELRTFATAPPPANINELTQPEEDQMSKHYDLLKVYLMLGERRRDKSNPEEIFNALKDFWFEESKLSPGLRVDADNQLKFYARQTDRLEGPGRFQRISINENLVADVRKKLLAFPPHKRYYQRKVTEISNIVDSKFGETTVDGLLQRNSGHLGYLEGTVGVPGAYTVEGYKLMGKAISDSAKELSESDWVMSDEDKPAATDIANLGEDANRIRELYFRDYSDRWREFIRGVRVRPYRKENDKDDTRVSAKEALGSFSSESSPMAVLLREVAKNTNLTVAPKPTGWFETLKNLFKSEELPDTGGNTTLPREFGPLHTFVEGDKESKIATYGSAIGRLSTEYNKQSDSQINELAGLQEEEKKRRFPSLDRARGDVDQLAKTFRENKSSTAAPLIADLLEKPVGNLIALLNADSLRQIGDRWINEVLPIAQAAEQGYPFEPGDKDADFNRLKAYLGNSEGKLSEFYKQNLEKYFEGNPGQLKLKDPDRSPFTDEFVTYLNRALTLRQALFDKGNEVKFDYNFELTTAKEVLVEITIDGTLLSSVDKPSSPLSFPAAKSGGNGVLIKMLSTGGTTAPSGPSANPAAAPVNSNSASPTPAPKKPAAAPNGNSSDERQFLGPWGLFRFFDESSPQKQSDNSYLVSLKLKNGKILTAKITPSGVDPFNKDIYKLRAPKTILK